MSKPLVSIVMGSDSDLEIMREAGKALEGFGIPYEIDVTSAHRSPDRTAEYARGAAGARNQRDHRGSRRRGASGRSDCRAYYAAGDWRSHSFDIAEWNGFAAGNGADAGWNSCGDSRHRQTGSDQRRNPGGANPGGR